MAFGKNNKDFDERIAAIMTQLNHIYNNKSSDEYKMRGDITKSKAYKSIENMLANLSQIKGYPKNDTTQLKNMFNVLHRPIYKQMVSEYLTEPNERNTLFTTFFTCGYRVLIAELSRIYASTVATDKGLVYKPDRISRHKAATAFIKAFNTNIEKEIDDCIRKNSKKSDLQIKQEAFVYQEALEIVSKIGGWLAAKEIAAWLSDISEVFDMILGRFGKFNPVSLVSHILTTQYDNKVKAFYNTKDIYEETLNAYNDYMKLPESDRKAKIESKYMKNIKKYNIKMENLRAQIAHYDSRAEAEATETVKKVKSTTSTNTSNGGGSTNTTTTTTTTTTDDDDIDW